MTKTTVHVRQLPRITEPARGRETSGTGLWAIVLLGAIMLMTPLAACRAAVSAVKVRDSLVAASALTIRGAFGASINGQSFQQDAVVSHSGYQYVAYYNAERRVCVVRRKLPDGEWSMIKFQDYGFRSNDAHNTISIGICPRDGTIHLAFDHHGHPLHYRVSQAGAASTPAAVIWEAGVFGPVTSELEKGKPIRITYPRFWQTPQGALQFCYRRGGSGNGDRMLVDYNPETGTWSGTRQIDSGKGLFADSMGRSTSRCSYPNGYDYGPHGKLHATWVWRESSQGANHDLIYVYSEDQGKTWRNSAGTTLPAPPHVSSPGIAVAEIGRGYGLMNTHGQAVDSRGRIHVVMWHCTDASLAEAGSKPGEHRWGLPQARRYHHYWRDTDGTWQHTELPGQAGNRPKIFFDHDDNAFLIFRAGAGELAIAAATAACRWTDWAVIHREQGPFGNEMLGDRYRWQADGVLSVLVQGAPGKPHDPTPLRILDFVFE